MQSDIPFPTQYAGDYRDRRRACGLQLYDSVGIEKGIRAPLLRCSVTSTSSMRHTSP